MIELFQDLWIFPLAGGILLAIMAAPLGCLMVWKRVAFFSDTLAHALLLGVALHFLVQLPLSLSLAGTALIFSVTLAFIYRCKQVPPDSFLVLLSQGGLALSILLMSFAGLSSVELLTYLVGDILILQGIDLLWMLGATFLVTVILWKLWPLCLSMIAHEDLAAIEGIPVSKIQLLLFVLMGFFMALSLKLTGALLLSAFLIAPPLSARSFAKTPEQMVGGAIAVGILSTCLGIFCSFVFNLPTGPSIVLCLLGFWGASHAVTRNS
ncbi:MAG: metal ABC transporter permease [Alphaproteobacteria bacterium]